MKEIRIYIASPYTKGDVAVNVRESMWAFHRILDLNSSFKNLSLVPHCPLLYHFLHIIKPRAYSEWLNLDLSWVKTCNVLVRLPGESKGADEEERYAEKNHILTVKGMTELFNYLSEVNEREERNEIRAT